MLSVCIIFHNLQFLFELIKKKIWSFSDFLERYIAVLFAKGSKRFDGV
mgnify:FL=1